MTVHTKFTEIPLHMTLPIAPFPSPHAPRFLGLATPHTHHYPSMHPYPSCCSRLTGNSSNTLHICCARVMLVRNVYTDLVFADFLFLALGQSDWGLNNCNWPDRKGEEFQHKLDQGVVDDI